MHISVAIGPLVSALVALHPIPSAIPAVSGSPASDAAPGERFAAEIAQRSAAGWRLGDIDVGYERGVVRISTLMVGPEHARWLNLVFDDFGAEPIAFSSLRASVPAQVKHYRAEADLVAAMIEAPPVALYEECGALYIDNGRDGAAVDDFDYYTIAARVDGADAPRALSDALAGALESDYQLVAVTTGAGGNTAEVELDGAERMVFVVGLDAAGGVTSVETRVSPPTHVWQTYARNDDLARSLRAAGSVLAIATGPGMFDADQAELALGGGGRYAIDIVDFDPADLECPC